MRKILAEKYTVQEQWEMIQKTCMEFQVEIDEEAKERFIQELESREWKVEEQVLLRIKNNVSSQIYELLLTQEQRRVISKEMAENILKKIESVIKKTQTIGFCRKGLSYE